MFYSHLSVLRLLNSQLRTNIISTFKFLQPNVPKDCKKIELLSYAAGEQCWAFETMTVYTDSNPKFLYLPFKLYFTIPQSSLAIRCRYTKLIGFCHSLILKFCSMYRKNYFPYRCSLQVMFDNKFLEITHYRCIRITRLYEQQANII